MSNDHPWRGRSQYVLFAKLGLIKPRLIKEIDTGANASAEEVEEGVEDGAVQVNNVVNSFRLNSTSFDKKQYLSHLKSAFLVLDYASFD